METTSAADSAGTTGAVDTNSASTGGETKTPTTTTPTAGQTGGTTKEGNWLDRLPEEHRTNPHFTKYKTEEEYWKGHLNLVSMVGKDKVIVPNEHTPDHERRDVYTKMGCPQSVEGYFEGFDQFDPKDTAFQRYGEIGHKHGVSKAAFQEMAQAVIEDGNRHREEEAAKGEAKAKAYGQELVEHWGDKAETNTTVAKRAFKQVISEDLQKRLIKRGFDGDPDIHRLFYELGKRVGEDTVGEVGNAGLVNNGSARERADAMVRDKNHPLNRRDHPDHKKAVEEHARLRAVASGGE